MVDKVKRNRKGKIPIPAKRERELAPIPPLPPYRPTAVPPKHPVRSPTPNRRGR
jgi:hypothetical protein